MLGIVNIGKGKGSSVTVDADLDSKSTNPVQNKAVYNAIEGRVAGTGISIAFAAEVPETLADGAIVMVYEE